MWPGGLNQANSAEELERETILPIFFIERLKTVHAGWLPRYSPRYRSPRIARRQPQPDVEAFRSPGDRRGVPCLRGRIPEYRSSTSPNFWPSLAARTSFAPFRARVVATARPIPRLAPVTMATLFGETIRFHISFDDACSRFNQHRKCLSTLQTKSDISFLFAVSETPAFSGALVRANKGQTLCPPQL